MTRTFDVPLVIGTIESLRGYADDFDHQEWVNTNIALTNDTGDVALFEIEKPGVVSGHYNFVSRGRAAIRAGKDFLDEVFNPCYNIEIIRGLTPLENLKARWMSRQLGFTSHGVVTSRLGPHEIFTLHRKDHLNE